MWTLGPPGATPTDTIFHYHRLARSRLRRPVEARDLRVELLADVEAFRTLLVAVAAEIGALDEAGRAVLARLHFEARIADFEHGDGDDRALVHLAAGCRRAADRRGAALELLHAERDALLLGIDVEHDRFAGLALAMQVERVQLGRANV